MSWPRFVPGWMVRNATVLRIRIEESLFYAQNLFPALRARGNLRPILRRKISFAQQQRNFTVFVLFLLSCTATHAQFKTALSSNAALYARVLRLSHSGDPSKNGAVVVSVTAFPNGSNEEDIYSSSDGVSFARIGAVQDADFSGGLCCGTLYELPSPVGTLAAGTLLWSGSVGQNSTTQPMQLKVYQSSDQGKTWTYLSNTATAVKIASAGGGLWEPQFEIASDGALVCIYSDETQAGHSQVLHQIRSYDGIHWQDATFTVASTIQSDRPGMPVVVKLPSGSYFMSYELCGPAACTVFSRTSADGWNWGDATNMGSKVTSVTGQWFEHAPTSVWATSATSANGTLLLTGQLLYESSGALSSNSGGVVFANRTADGSGSWTTMPAPVKISDAYDNYCPNYSSPLLPSVDGQSLLEFASDYAGSICTMYYGSAADLAGTQLPTVSLNASSSSINSAEPVTVKIVVAGAATDPVAQGTVTLSTGAYKSNAVALAGGTASMTVPANTLAIGANTVTASYSGDANYAANSGNVSITVTAAVTPTFTVAGSALTITAGATTGNTSVVTVAPGTGFTGSVTLTAQIASGPASAQSLPTLSFGATSPVNITASSAANAILTVSTVGAHTALLRSPGPAGGSLPPRATTLASVFFFGIPLMRRRRGPMSIWLCLVLLTSGGALGACGVMGCGGGSSAGGTGTVQSGTTPGVYNVTVTGTSGSLVASNSFALTVQ